MGSGFVLDASVAIRWALQDGSVSDRVYADQILDSFSAAPAWVPALWYTETIHVLRCAEDSGKLGESALTGFVYRLAQLPITLDSAAPSPSKERAIDGRMAVLGRGRASQRRFALT